MNTHKTAAAALSALLLGLSAGSVFAGPDWASIERARNAKKAAKATDCTSAQPCKGVTAASAVDADQKTTFVHKPHKRIGG